MVLFIDNQCVLLGVITGAYRLPEVSFAIARLWIHMAEEEIGLQAWRMELKANVADGPTRDYYVVVNRLKAEFREPMFDLFERSLEANGSHLLVDNLHSGDVHYLCVCVSKALHGTNYNHNFKARLE